MNTAPTRGCIPRPKNINRLFSVAIENKTELYYSPRMKRLTTFFSISVRSFLMFVSLLLVSLNLSAQENMDSVKAIDRSPLDGTELIGNKKYSAKGKFELDLLFERSFSDSFISHTGGQLSLAYHISDWFALELFGAAYYPLELNVYRFARSEAGSSVIANRSDRVNPRVDNAWQNFASGGLLLQWAPLYGKLSLISELDLTYQFYFVGGVTADAIAKPNDPGSADALTRNYDYFANLGSGVNYTTKMRLSGIGGLGLRFYPWRWLTMRVEVRSRFGANNMFGDDSNGLDFVVLPSFIAGLGAQF